MATLFSEFGAGKSPVLYWTVTYTETARTATTATYSATIKYAIKGTSSSVFNYDMTAYIAIGNSGYQSVAFGKIGTAPKTITKTITGIKATGISAGTSSISASFKSSTNAGSTSGTTSGYVPSKSGNVTCSVYNTAPSLSGSCTVSGITFTGNYYNEKQGSAKLSIGWPAASDSQGGTITYYMEFQTNGGAWVPSGSTTSRTGVKTETWSGFNSFRFRVRARDNGGLYSGYIYSSTYTKNTFTKASVTSNVSKITKDTTKITLTPSGAKNTNGDTSFTYDYYVTVGSGESVSGTLTGKNGALSINLWHSYLGVAAPDAPYIKLVSANLTSSITYKLTTINHNKSAGDSTGTWTKDIGAGQPISFSSGVSVTGGETSGYYVPNLGTKISLSVPKATDKVGRPASKYELYYNNIKIKDVTTEGTHDISWAEIGSPKKLTDVTFKAIAISPGGASVTSTAPSSIPVHYYELPSVSVKTVAREIDTVKVSFNLVSRTSITGVNTDKNFVFTGSTATPVVTGTNPNFVAVITKGVSESESGTVVIKVRDEVGTLLGVTTLAELSAKYGSYTPVLSVRKRGVGVNAVGGTKDGVVLDINGKAHLNGNDILTMKKAIVGTNVAGEENRWYKAAEFTAPVVNHDMEMTFWVASTYANLGDGILKIHLRAASSPFEYITQRFVFRNISGALNEADFVSICNGTTWSLYVRTISRYQFITLAPISISNRVNSNDSPTLYTSGDGTGITALPSGVQTVATTESAKKLHLSGGNQDMIKLYADDHGYITFHKATDGIRRGYIGNASAGTDDITLSCDIGKVLISGRDGVQIRTFELADGNNSRTSVIPFEALPADMNGLRVRLGGNGQTIAHGGEFKEFDGKAIYDGGSAMHSTTTEDLVLMSDRYVLAYWNQNDGYSPANGVMGFGNQFLPTKKDVLNLGNSSYRWTMVYAQTGTIQTSDSKYKENITPLTENTLSHYLLGKDRKTFYEFMKDMPLYQYNYVLGEAEVAEVDVDRGLGSYQSGFLADEVHKMDPEYASRFIYQSSEGDFLTSNQSYAVNIHLALQEAMRKIDELENRLNALNQ